MSEFITIQVGQCGNQIGSAFWPLVLQEYGINNVPGGIQRSTVFKPKKQYDDSFTSFFHSEEEFALSSSNFKYSNLKNFNVKARAILIDMEDSVVDRYHVGPLKHLFDQSCTIKNYPGSGNNWAEGFYTHGSKYCDKITKTIRESVEKCNNLAGFLIMYSVGGGTGSGLGSFVLQLLQDEFPNIDRFVTCVYPNGSEDVITCPYNMALATKYLTEYATCVFPVENRALLNIVKKQKGQKQCVDTSNYITKCKPFQDMNTIIVNMLLHLTCGSRFSGSLNVDMNDLSTNLIPFPNIHFICSSVSPLTVSLEKFRNISLSRKFHNDIFLECCHRKNQLLNLDPLGLNSILLSTTLIGRGDFAMSDMRNFVNQIQNRCQFTNWSQQAIKIGLCGVPPAGHSSSMLALFNSSAMISLFDDVLKQFNKLYTKKAHVHHYNKVEGFDESLFEDCKEKLCYNINNYESIKDLKKTKPRFRVL